MMPAMILSYLDLRPILFAGGLPVFVLLAVVIGKCVRVKTHSAWVATLAGLLYAVLFFVFLTEYGPFLGNNQTRSVQVRWEIKPSTNEAFKEPEVVLHFEGYPDCWVGDYSRELAEHLSDGSAALIQAKMEVTYDYGTPRGFFISEIDGLRGWKSEWSYAASSGSTTFSPWD